MNASLLGLWWKHSDAGAVIILFIFATFSPHEPQPSWQIYVPTDGIYMGSLEMCCFMAWIMHLHKQPEVVPLYFSSTSPSLFLFQDLSWFLFSWFINILWPFYKLFSLIKNSYSHFLNIFRITSFYDQQVFQNSTHHFFSFFICLCQSLN